MSIAVVLDSNSGVTKEEAKELGLFVRPMPFMVDGNVYYEGVDLSHEEFYRKQAAGSDISTSQPSPEDVMGTWDELLKEYDELVYIPMSSSLSGSCQTALMLSEEYDGRVQVVDNLRISITQRQAGLDARMLAEKGWSAKQIREKLEETRSDSIIYAMVDTLKYLKKGGRITPAAAALGTLLKIKPVLVIDGGKLDAFAKARTTKQAKSLMLTALSQFMEHKFGDPKGECCHLMIAHSDSPEAAEGFRQEMEEFFPGADVFVAPLSLSIACHIGPGVLAVACSRKIEA